MKRILLAALLLSTCLACGGSDDNNNNNATITSTCNFDAEDFCDVVTGTAAALDDADATQADCTGTGGTFGTPCTDVGRIGRCTIVIGAVSLTEHYYPPSWDEASAHGLCTAFGGTWTAN